MRLDLLSYTEMQEYTSKHDAAILAIGSTEQHSPDGILGTDYLIADALAQECARRLKLISVPVIPFGIAIHHMEFSGTITLRPTTLIALLEDQINSLYRHGIKKFFFINGHGGNINTILAAFQQISANLRIAAEVASWWHLPEVQAKERELFGDVNGQHATVSEISVTRYLYPEAFQDDNGNPKKFKKTDYPTGRPDIAWPLHARSFQENFPYGNMSSDPTKANAKDGKIIFELAVDTIATLIDKFLNKSF